MDIFDSRYYKQNKWLLALIGLWPYQNRNSKLIQRLLIISCIFSIQIPMLKTLYEEMQRDWDLQKNKEELKIMHDTAEEGRRYCFWVSVYITMAAVIYLLSAFLPKVLDLLLPLEEPRPPEFPVPAEYLVDANKYYYHISVHMMLSMSVAFTVLLAADTMYMAHAHYACGLFSITGYHMKQLFNGTLTDKEMSYRISNVVHYHRKAMRFVNAITSIHDWEFSVTMGLITANISLTLYFVASVMDMSLRTLRAVTSVLGQMCHVFIDIYAAQKIINNSSGLYHNVYNSKWYTASANTQKLILILMSASINPCHILLTGLFVISVETYSSILQTAISYFTVLHSMTSTN